MTSSSSSGDRRARFMRDLFDRYERDLRGKKPAASSFWDLVVLSAGDDDQKGWYETQLDSKKARGELPMGVPFRVFPDPGGIRTGDGGATLSIVSRLHEEFGPQLAEMKTLLIHAGGFSKRLPSHSCTSKIFSPMPVDSSSSSYDMLDMKMLMYLPFCDVMTPGTMFVTASDDLEGYNIEPDDLERIRADFARIGLGEAALISLAHPSSLAVGTGHGVFKFAAEDAAALLRDGSARLLSGCLEVLQKPSEQKMREKGVILTDEKTGDELVYTDSAYWLNRRLVEKLAAFYEQVRPVRQETSIYSDFMTCQGRADLAAKVHAGRLMSSADPLKQSICRLMSGVPLHIVALPESTFYHIGTLTEYLHAFCDDAQLAREMRFGRAVCSGGVVISSRLPAGLHVPERVVVEFSTFESSPVRLQSDTIVSNCYVELFGCGEEAVALPGERVYHTVPIRTDDDGGDLRFVTVSFHVRDDLKRAFADASDVLFGGKRLAELLVSVPGRVIKDGEDVCLWNARLFPAADSMAESFRSTLKLLTDMSGVLAEDGFVGYSMADLMVMKDKESILSYRRQFYDYV